VKKKFNVYGVIAMVLVVLFVMTGCKKDEEEDDAWGVGSISLNEANQSFTYDSDLDYKKAVALFSDGSIVSALLAASAQRDKNEITLDIGGNGSTSYNWTKNGINQSFGVGAATVAVRGSHREEVTTNKTLAYLQGAIGAHGLDLSQLENGTTVNVTGNISREYKTGSDFYVSGNKKIAGRIDAKYYVSAKAKVERDVAGKTSDADDGRLSGSYNDDISVSAVVIITDNAGKGAKFQFTYRDKFDSSRAANSNGGSRLSDVKVYNGSNQLQFTLKGYDVDDFSAYGIVSALQNIGSYLSLFN